MTLKKKNRMEEVTLFDLKSYYKAWKIKKCGINLKIEKWINGRVQPIFSPELDLNISEHLNCLKICRGNSVEKANLFNKCPWNNWTSICGFLGGSVVKETALMPETQVPSLGWGDSLEKQMATHSSILAWKIPWTEEPGWLQSLGSQRVGCDWARTCMHAEEQTQMHTLHLIEMNPALILDLNVNYNHKTSRGG